MSRTAPRPPWHRSAAALWIKAYPVVLIFVALIALFAFLYPERFLTSANLTASLRQFATLMLFAIGPSIVMVTGSLDLSFIGVWMLGTALLWLLVPVVGLPAILIFPLLGLVTGLVIGLIHTRAKIPSFILTLSVLVIYWGLTVIISGGFPRTVSGFEFMTARLIPGVPSAFLLSIPVIIASIYIMTRSKLGTYFCAIGSNEEGARLAGIDVARYKTVAFVLSGLFTGIGSALLFQHLGGSVAVNFNLNDVVRPLVVIILGGTPLLGGSGGPQRTILGVITFTALYRGLHISPLRPEMIDLVVGLVLIAAIILGSRATRMKGVTIT